MDVEIYRKQCDIMEKEDLDALIALSPENFAYVTGVNIPSQNVIRERHAIYINPRESEPLVIVVEVEESFAREELSIRDIRTYNEFTQSPMDVLSNVLKTLNIEKGRIAIETSYLPAKDYFILKRRLPQVQVRDATDLFCILRMKKTKREIEILNEVGKAAEKSIEEAFEKISEGDTEKDLARYLMNAFFDKGGENVKMLVVGSGKRSCHPNATPTDKTIKRGDLVRVDMIGTYRNYYSDCARTGVMIKPKDKQLRIYEKIAEIYNSILPKIQPGASTQELYKFYRRLTKRYSLSPLKFLGHGLGLGLHEEPYINVYSDIKLEENMVMCVEPLHFVPRVEGYHLENELIITKDGYEIITNLMENKLHIL